MELAKIMGLKVVGIKGLRLDKRKKKGFSPKYILFGDGQTFIEIDDQEYFTYHDCDPSAKTISLQQCDFRWKEMNEDISTFPDADLDIYMCG